MFSVFYKDTLNGETEFKFKSCQLNKAGDSFFSKSLENLHWDVADCKVYEYSDESKYFIFMRWNDDHDPDHKIFVDGADGILHRITLTKRQKVFENSSLPFEHPDAATTYTAQENNEYAANVAHWAAWLIHGEYNSEAAQEDQYSLMVASTHGDFATAWPAMQQVDYLCAREFTSHDSIAGSIVDIDAKVAAEA